MVVRVRHCRVVIGRSGPASPPTHQRAGQTRHRGVTSQSGYSLIELVVAMGVLTALMSLAFSAQADLASGVSLNTSRAYVVDRVRGAMENVARVLRDQLVEFNNVPATSLGVNVDLDDIKGPLVRDAILFYFDSKGQAQLYDNGSGLPATAGLTDANGDGKADVIGIGLVRQNLNVKTYGLGNNGYQDFIDLNHDGQPDDLDGDGNPDPLWTLTLVQFNKIDDVSTAALWKQGRVLTTNAYIRRIDKTGALTGDNIPLFQFSAHNPLAMWYDLTDQSGNFNGVADEAEIGNMTTKDGIINDANEVASIDSITITLNTVEIVNLVHGGTMVLSGDISSDIITPRPLALMRRNGIIGTPDPTLATNIK